MASIIRRGEGVWQVQASGGYRVDGRPRRVSRTVHGSYEDARTAAIALELELGGNPALGSGITLDAYFEGVYLKGHADLDPKTVSNYRTLWRLHVSPKFGSRELADPPAAEVQRWVSSMPRGTAVHSAKLLRAVLRDAWYLGILPQEPMRRPLRYPKAVYGKLDVWGADEVLDALSRLHGHKLAALVAVMAGAGLRRSEAMALRWEDMDWRDGYVRMTVSRSARRADGLTKTEGSVRTVAIMEPFASALAACRMDGGPVCPMNERNVKRNWQALFADGGALHGMRYIPMKQLRATNTTLMHEAGVPDTVLSLVHGHTDVRTDYRHYIAPTSTAADTAARMLQHFMSESAPLQQSAADGASA